MSDNIEDPHQAGLESLTSVPLEEIKAACEYLKGRILRTPLVPLNYDHNGKKIYLKLENLHQTGSFKERGAGNALGCLSQEAFQNGVYTCSAGNFAQGLALNARKIGVSCTIVVPSSAPQIKVDAIKRLGAHVITVPYDTWWQILQSHHYEGIKGHFIHPSCDRNVIAGNGSIGLEILEDLPDVDTVIAPYGGGGLCTGVASAIKAHHPHVKVFACEVETAAPLAASLASGKPSAVPNHRSSFVDGMGGKSLFPEMWNLARNLIDDSIIVSLNETCDALRLSLERNHIVVEGAGAAAVAAAMQEKVQGKNIVCVISGGNIDSHKLISILQGHIPN